MPDNVVHVPKPSARSFNSKRSLDSNALLKNQVKHFREVEKTLPPELRVGIDSTAIATEGGAAEYIRKMTALLHPEGASSGKARKAQ